jgi:hypothetical protein
MVELLIGFVCFCGLFLWMRLGVRCHCYYLYSVVCQQIWRMYYRCSFRDIQGSKRPNTINFLFQILLFYFEELKKTNSNINVHTEELLEKIMLAKTNHKKLWKFYWKTMAPYSKAHSKEKSTKTDKTDKKLNHLSFQSTEQLKNNIFLTWYRHFPGKMVSSDSR